MDDTMEEGALAQGQGGGRGTGWLVLCTDYTDCHSTEQLIEPKQNAVLTKKHSTIKKKREKKRQRGACGLEKREGGGIP